MTTTKQRRKAQFAEKARHITQRERANTVRNNLSQEIAAAMEYAFKLGQKSAQQNDNETVDEDFSDLGKKTQDILKYAAIYHDRPNAGFVYLTTEEYALLPDVNKADYNGAMVKIFKESTINRLIKQGLLIKDEDCEWIAYRLSDRAKLLIKPLILK